MKVRRFGKEVALIVCFTIFLPASSFALESHTVTLQGSIMGLDWSQCIIVVNEKIFTWEASSIFYDEKGHPFSITSDRLKDGTWVSIEAIWRKNKPHLIKTLSLIKR